MILDPQVIADDLSKHGKARLPIASIDDRSKQVDEGYKVDVEPVRVHTLGNLNGPERLWVSLDTDKWYTSEKAAYHHEPKLDECDLFSCTCGEVIER